MLYRILTQKEVEATEAALRELEGVAWARPLVSRARAEHARFVGRGGSPHPAKAAFLEVRVARDVHRAGYEAVYEACVGVDGTSVDFLVRSERQCLIEVCSLEESDALRNATFTRGMVSGFSLSTSNQDPRQTREGEMIKAQERIVAKVFDGIRPIKFPKPTDCLHVILVDVRAAPSLAGDLVEYVQMSRGPRAVPKAHWELLHWWPPSGESGSPIRGLFEPECPIRGAELIQSRIHALGFVAEGEYAPGEIRERAFYSLNPTLLPDPRAFLLYSLLPSSAADYVRRPRS